jgi:hypothetical protein
MFLNKTKKLGSQSMLVHNKILKHKVHRTYLQVQRKEQ